MSGATFIGSNGFTGLAFRFFVVYINQMLIPRNIHLQPTSYFRDKYTTFVNKNYKLRKIFSNLYESFQPDDYRYNSIFRKISSCFSKGLLDDKIVREQGLVISMIRELFLTYVGFLVTI